MDCAGLAVVAYLGFHKKGGPSHVSSLRISQKETTPCLTPSPMNIVDLVWPKRARPNALPQIHKPRVSGQVGSVVRWGEFKISIMR